MHKPNLVRAYVAAGYFAAAVTAYSLMPKPLPEPKAQIPNQLTIEAFVADLPQGKHPGMWTEEKIYPNGDRFSKDITVTTTADAMLRLHMDYAGRVFVDYSRGNNDSTAQHHEWAARGSEILFYRYNEKSITHPIQIDAMQKENLPRITQMLRLSNNSSE